MIGTNGYYTDFSDVVIRFIFVEVLKIKVSEIKYENLTQEIIDKIIFDGIDDNQLCGDCIIVLGSAPPHKYRLPKAVEMYNDKRSDKILVCGGTVWETENGNISEAHAMREKLLESGIPSDDILVENMSSNTIENFICSAYVLNRTFQIANVKTLLLVTTRFHMRRSLMWAEVLMPKWITVYPCPADDRHTLRHNWYLHEKNKKIVMDEAYKISCYVRAGCFPDFEI